MKTIKKRMIWFGAISVVGIALFITSLVLGKSESTCTFGAALALVGMAKIIQFSIISRDSAKLKDFETKQREERLIMLAEKSGRFTLMITITAELLAAVVLLFAGNEQLAMGVAIIAAIQSLIYLISYLCLSRKF